MAAMDVEALIKRAERAETKRQHFSRLMQDVFAYAMPERDSWNAYGYGQQRNVQVYDSSAVVSLARFANRLQQALFPPAQRWCRLALPPEMATEDAKQELQADLEAATELLFRHIHASNFDMSANEYCQELGAGVACLLIENGRIGTRRRRAPLLRFQAVPSGYMAYDEGPFGVVEGQFFHQKLAARMVRRTYPDAQELPEDPEAEVELLQATTYDAEDDLYRLEVIHKPTKARFVERKYRTNPWVVTRWTKAPGETHGRGPLTQALPDIRTVNKLVELMLKTGSIAVGGVWTARDDGVLNPANVSIRPGAVIPVQSNGAGPLGPSLRALDFPGNFQLSEVLHNFFATRIRQTLFDDPLPPEVQVGLTATEVIERVRRFQADTGAFGRLMNDALVPIVVRCIDILDEAGEWAQPRFAGLMDALRDDLVRVQPTGPLSLAQDQADVQAVMQFAAGAAQMGEFGARMLRTGLDADRAGPWVSARMGVPQALIPNANEVKTEDAAAKQTEAERALLQSPAAAQVAGAMANAAMQPGGEPAA
jgi:hypothetical protein